MLFAPCDLLFALINKSRKDLLVSSDSALTYQYCSRSVENHA